MSGSEEPVVWRSRGEQGAGESLTGSGEGSGEEKKVVLAKDQPGRWRKWTIRSITCWTLIGIFWWVVRQGPVFVSVILALLQLVAFSEIVAVGYAWNKEEEKDLPLFRVQQWYFFFVAFFVVYGRDVLGYFAEYFVGGTPDPVFEFLIVRHSMVSFLLYILGFVVFVMTLKQGHYKEQLGQYGWTHMSLLGIVLPTRMVIANLFDGLFWFVMPSTLVFCNDITAYMWGFHFGRTPLIKLSPKKTWEGFLGAAGCTVIWGWWFAGFMAQHQWVICPAHDPSCNPASAFLPTELPIASTSLLTVLGYLGFNVTATSLVYLPIQVHCVILAVFASIIGPFGGFFGSAVKRANHTKDFGHIFPGHGGMLDRVDCQFLMGVFTLLYQRNFVNHAVVSVTSLVAQVMSLPDVDRAEFLRRVCESCQ